MSSIAATGVVRLSVMTIMIVERAGVPSVPTNSIPVRMRGSSLNRRIPTDSDGHYCLPNEPSKYSQYESVAVIVVATGDFELYHELVSELRERDVNFTTIEPAEELPDRADVVLTGADDPVAVAESDTGVPIIEASPGSPRLAVDEALAALRGHDGRTVVGIDPGDVPGIAVLVGERVVATFQVSPEDVAEIVHEETADAPNPVVRIGDGARLIGARIIDDIEDVPIELVDETGTTPYLGAGVRGVADIIAAVNIARMEGEPVESREITPTEGELHRIQQRSREQSPENREIDAELARRVAVGELTIEEALVTHRKKRE